MSEMIQVPDGWEVKKLSEVGEIITGNTPSTDNQEYYNGNIPFVGPSDLGEEKYILKSKKTITSKGFEQTRKLPKNSILVTCIGELGKIGISKLELATNQQINSLVCNKKFDTEFVYYALGADIKSQMQKEAGLQVVQIVNKSSFSKLNLIIPKEKKEQEKIAKILSTLDKAIESTNRLIEKEKNIKTALMQELLTNGIDKNGQIRSPQTHTYKQSELGLIPDEWDIEPFSKVASINMGQSPESEFVNENQIGIPFLQGNAEFGDKYPIEIYWTPQPKKTSKANDILISVRAPVGDINISEKEYCIGRGLASLTIKNIDLGFGYYALIEERYQLNRLAQGSTFLAIGKNDFDKLMVKIPTSKSEQKQIAKILTTQDKKIQTEETNLAKLKELKKGLMNDLLSGKVRVKI